jgi:hypothetical protein
MNPDPSGMDLIINGESFTMNTPVDGIALDREGKFIYYCPLAGYRMYRISREIAQVKHEFGTLNFLATFHNINSAYL